MLNNHDKGDYKEGLPNTNTRRYVRYGRQG